MAYFSYDGIFMKFLELNAMTVKTNFHSCPAHRHLTVA